MSKITEKQLKFVKYKAEGLTNVKAMVAAGFSPTGAAQNATKLMARADIKKAIASAKRDNMKPIDQAIAKMQEKLGIDPEEDAKNKLPRDHYADPRDLLFDAMNHKGLGVTTRAGFAIQLMPYVHARIGEKGKKETAKDDAREVAGGRKEKARADGKPQFSPGKPPRLHSVK